MSNKKLNEMIIHSAKNNSYPYVSVDTPNGEPRCPYCGNWGVAGVDDFRTETKFFCDECENEFLMDNDTGEYSTRNRVPLKPYEEKEKEQE